MATLSKVQIPLLLLLVAGAACSARAQSVPATSNVTFELSLPEYISELDRCSQTLARARFANFSGFTIFFADGRRMCSSDGPWQRSQVIAVKPALANFRPSSPAKLTAPA